MEVSSISFFLLFGQAYTYAALNKILGKFKTLFNPIDLTTGKVYKVIIIFLIPILLSLLFQQIYTLTDAIIVGDNLSDAEASGVNSTSTLVWLVLYFGIGATSGFSVILSDRVGAKEEQGQEGHISPRSSFHASFPSS